MKHDIDDLIRAASEASSEARLTTLEAGVWSRVQHKRDRMAARRGQASGLALAVMIGAVGGGLMSRAERPAPSELQVLTVEAALEPFSIASRLG
jgi:hypothetical protein